MSGKIEGEEPELSIIIPAFNARDTLPLCLQALELQTLPRDSYEIIAVDDGSTDDTAAIVRQFSVLYHYQVNQGPAAARNAGAALSRGSYIFFTDADCVPDSDWLQEMRSSFDDPEVIAVKGAYRTEQKRIIARFSQLEFEERFRMLSGLHSIDMIDTYSAGFKKEIFQSLGGFDTRFPVANNEDTELSYRMAALGYRMVFNPHAVVRHLNHPDSVMRYFRLKFSRGFWRMMVYQMFPDKMVKDSYTPQTLKLQIVSLFVMGVSLLLLPVFPSLAGLVLLCSSLVFIAQVLPFTLSAFRKDAVVGALSPILLALRAVAIGSGVFWAVIRMRMGKSIFNGTDK